MICLMPTICIGGISLTASLVPTQDNPQTIQTMIKAKYAFCFVCSMQFQAQRNDICLNIKGGE